MLKGIERDARGYKLSEPGSKSEVVEMEASCEPLSVGDGGDWTSPGGSMEALLILGKGTADVTVCSLTRNNRWRIDPPKRALHRFNLLRRLIKRDDILILIVLRSSACFVRRSVF